MGSLFVKPYNLWEEIGSGGCVSADVAKLGKSSECVPSFKTCRTEQGVKASTSTFSGGTGYSDNETHFWLPAALGKGQERRDEGIDISIDMLLPTVPISKACLQYSFHLTFPSVRTFM